MAPRRVHLLIRGDVQGVGFRGHVRARASALGLRGWVRNLADGRVEVVAEGEAEPLELLIAWCRRGPTMAEVEEVDIRWEPYRGEFEWFEIVW